MQMKSIVFYIQLLLLPAALAQTIPVETTTEPLLWYLGCYVAHGNLKDVFYSDRTDMSKQPIECAKYCHRMRCKHFALSETHCSCVKNMAKMLKVPNEECYLRCDKNTPNPCGGKTVYSVFISRGPYIVLIEVRTIPLTPVVGLDTIFIIRVGLGAPETTIIGIDDYHASLEHAVIVTKVDSSVYTVKVNISNSRGKGRFKHVFTSQGFFKIYVNVTNAISSMMIRRYKTPLLIKPESVILHDAIKIFDKAVCTPQHIAESKGYRKLPTVARGFVSTNIELSAILNNGGINVTYTWLICHLGHRRATPHLESKRCSEFNCEHNAQVFQLEEEGVCPVSVTVFNDLGRASTQANVVVVKRDMKNLILSLGSCKVNCRAIPEFLPPLVNYPLIPTRFAPTTAPTVFDENNFQIEPPPGVYLVNTNVCFEGSMYLTVRKPCIAYIKYGDGLEATQVLRIKDTDAESTVKLLTHANNITACYLNYCNLRLYFSHNYTEPGEYTLQVQINGGGFQINSNYTPIKIVRDGADILNWKLQCEEVIASGAPTLLYFPEHDGSTFKWTLSRRHDGYNSSDPSTSAKWGQLRTIMRRSPLRHTFVQPGAYHVRINDSDSNNAGYCIIKVEKRVGDITFALRPEIRYVTVGKVIRVDLRVRQGTNFSVTWNFANETVESEQRYDALYMKMQRFVPTFVGCQNLSVTIRNTISNIAMSTDTPVCSEEKISGMSLLVPSFLEVGQPANITATISSGSHVQLSIDVVCHEGVHLMSFNHVTGATVGKATFNFTTSPFPEPGYFHVVMRAKNHVTVRQNRGPRLIVRKRIKVGRFIENIAIRLAEAEDSKTAYNDDENILMAVVNGLPDKSSGILYEWIYPNDTNTAHGSSQATLYTASPIVKIRPICNMTSDIADCVIRLTAISGVSNATVFLNVTSSTFRRDQSSLQSHMRHNIVSPTEENLLVDADCTTTNISHTGCQVSFSDTKFFVRFAANTTTSLGHVFTTSGLWKITKDVLTSFGTSAESYTSFVSVQEKILKLKIKGDELLVLDETPTGNWRAITRGGSYLVFQWTICHHNTSNVITTLTRVACVRELAYHFNQTGFYDVIVTVFNDVSRMQASTIVEVRHPTTHIEINTQPNYLGDNSIFVISVNVSQAFSLTVLWSDDDEIEIYTQDQLKVVEDGKNSKGLKRYSLTHLYQTVGRHKYTFILEWLASDDLITREIVGHISVYDLIKSPPVFFDIWVDEEENLLEKPYDVSVGDVVKINASMAEIVTSLCWTIRNTQDDNVTSSGCLNITSQRIVALQFVPTTPGLYLCNITIYPGNLGVTANIAASYPLTTVVMDRPYSLYYNRSIDYCNLYAISKSKMQCAPFLFRARADGYNVTFQFKFQRIRKTQSSANYVKIITMNATTTNARQDGLINEARLEYTFEREGTYNISVTCFGVSYHANEENVPSISTSLNSLFHAETEPLASLWKKDVYLEVGKSSTFFLIQKDPEQTLTVNWDMRDGTQYKNAGLTVNHSFNHTGKYEVDVEFSNHVDTKWHSFRAHVYERLLSAKLELPTKGFYATNKRLVFEVTVVPEDAGENFYWYLSNINKPMRTYKPILKHVFEDPETVIVKVEVSNKISTVESNLIELNIERPVPPFKLYAPIVTQVSKSFRVYILELNSNSKFLIEWNMGDGTKIENKFFFNHTYVNAGVYNVNITLKNNLSSNWVEQKIFALKESCSKQPAVNIGGSHQREHYRSKQVQYEALVDFNCSNINRIEYHWTVKSYSEDDVGILSTSSNVAFSGHQKVFNIPPRSLEYGKYEVTVNITFVGTILYIFDTVTLTIIPSKLVGQIQGGTYHLASRNSVVSIDASQSYDPDYPDDKNFVFEWGCFMYASPATGCFKNETFPTTMPVLTTTASAAKQTPSHILPTISNRYMGFPSSILTNQSVLTIPGDKLVDENTKFIFKLYVIKRNRQKSTVRKSVVIWLKKEGRKAGLSIYCPTCQDATMLRQDITLFNGRCNNCFGGILIYEWKIKEVDDHTRSFYRNESSDCAPPDGTGWQSLLGFVNATSNLTAQEADLPPLQGQSHRLRSATSTDFFPHQLSELESNNSNFSGITPVNPFLGPSSSANTSDGSNQRNKDNRNGLTIVEAIAGGRVFYQPDERTGTAKDGDEEEGSSTNRLYNYGRDDDQSRISDDLITPNRNPKRKTIDNHYQDLRHLNLPRHRLATISNDGELLMLMPGSLTEGKTYAIEFSVRHYSTSHLLLKSGLGSYYVRVVRGPSFGECSVAPGDREDMFRVHCIQWKNQQNKKLDNIASVNEMLTYEISYSLSKYGKRRPLYKGSLHERSFRLPASPHFVYIHVTLHNTVGATTKVCSFPVKVTRPERKAEQSMLSDFQFVYSSSVVSKSGLKHWLLLSDQNAILGYVHFLLDSLPPKTALHQLIKEHPEVEEQLTEVTVACIQAIATLDHNSVERRINILYVLSRALNFLPCLDIQNIVMATEITLQILNGSRDEFDLKSGNMRAPSHGWTQLAKELQVKPVSKDFVDGVLLSLEKLIYSVDRFLQCRDPFDGRGLRHAVKLILQIEEELRDFYLDCITAKFSTYGGNLTKNGIRMVVQPFHKHFYFNESNFYKVGAEYPNEVICHLERHNQFVFQTGIAYMDRSPYISIDGAIKMDGSALSLWLIDEKQNEVMIRDLSHPIKIYLPQRKKQVENRTFSPCLVTRKRMCIHEFNHTPGMNSSYHVEIIIDDAESRPFDVVVALSKEQLSSTRPSNDSNIIRIFTLNAKRRRSMKAEVFTGYQDHLKFTFESDKIESNGPLFVTLWSDEFIKSSKRRRRRQNDKIQYSIDIWTSNCFYWDRQDDSWSREGLKILPESTLEQTICSSSHLSTFSSSFEKVKTTLYFGELTVIVTAHALPRCLTVLVFICAFFLILLAIDRYVLRHRELREDPDDTTKPLGIGDYLRWRIGTADRESSGRVPILLRDNKTEHKQVFEVTIQTGNWPGSGTSSLPHIVLYGEAGKYEARELMALSTQNTARENYRTTKNEPQGRCLFETGSTATFIVTFEKNLGPLYKLNIWHDHSGTWPRWYLDYVIVRDVNSGERWYFSCHQWLALDRDTNRISVDLSAMGEKPSLVQHFARRMRNYLFDYHSLVSVFACAHWVALTRSQRIVNAMTLCLAVSGMTTGKFILAENFDESLFYFNADSMIWGLLISIATCMLLLPVQLVLRFMKQDERISIAMVDTTSGGIGSHYDSWSRASITFKDRDTLFQAGNYGGQGGTGVLRKTARIDHALTGLDDVIDSVPTSNDVVSDWLQLKEWNEGEKSCQETLPHAIEPFDPLYYWPYYCSDCSIDDEIVRSMMMSSPSTFVAHDQPDRIMPDSSCDGDCSSLSFHANDFNESVSNLGHSRHPSNDTMFITARDSLEMLYMHRMNYDEFSKPSHLAMDGPVLVPCEKLEPLPQTQLGLLPTQCGYIAWTYYGIICFVASGMTIYGAGIFMEDLDYARWLETVFYAIFWKLVVIETVGIALATLFSTCRNVVKQTSLNETLPELFPTVDAATVDDPSYKYYNESRDAFTVNDHSTGDLNDFEVEARISERRRARYLRNISSPYNQKGRWKEKNDPLRKLSRVMRKKSAAKQAACSWLALVFLVIVLTAIISSQVIDRKNRLRESSHISSWFESGFIAYEESTVCTFYNSTVMSIHDVTSQQSWERWFESTFFFSFNDTGNTGNMSLPHYFKKENNLLLGQLKITYLLRDVSHKCHKVPQEMKQILLKSVDCVNISNVVNEANGERLIGSDGSAYRPIDHINLNLLQRNRFLYQNMSSQNSSQAIHLEMVVYNPMSGQYSVIKNLWEFNSKKTQTSLVVHSVSLAFNEGKARDWLIHCHVIMLTWVAWCALSLLLLLVEYNVIGKDESKKLSKRLFFQNTRYATILNLAIWTVAVFYLIFSSILSHKSFLLMLTLETSNHLNKNVGMLLMEVLRFEYVTLCFLGLWTVLLVLEGLHLAVTLHGFSSKLTYSLTALYKSTSTSFKPIIIQFVVIILIFSLLSQLLFGFSLKNYKSFSASLQKTLHDATWLGLTGGHTRSTLKEHRTYSDPFFTILYFGTLFVCTHLILKGFIVASHQWWHRNRITSGRAQKDLKSQASQNLRKKHKPRKSKRSLKVSSRLGGAHQLLKGERGQYYVSFTDIWRVSRDETIKFLNLALTSLFCGEIPRWLHCFRSINESSEDDKAQGSNRSYSFSSYDKKKLVEESEYFTSEISGYNDLAAKKGKLAWNDNVEIKALEVETDNYKLCGDIAMSEIELQVNELYLKATALLDDVMSSFGNLEKRLKREKRHSSDVGFGTRSEDRIKQIAEDLIDYKHKSDCDVATVVTSVTLPPFSEATSLHSSTTPPTKKKKMRKRESLASMEENLDAMSTVSQSQSFSHHALGSQQNINIISSKQMQEPAQSTIIKYCEVDKNKEDCFEKETDVLRVESPLSQSTFEAKPKKSFKLRKVAGSKISTDEIDLPESNSPHSDSDTSLPSLSTLNIVCHDRRLHRTRSDAPSTPPADVPTTSSYALTLQEEALRQASSRRLSKMGQEDGFGSGNPAINLWKMLVRKRRRRRLKTSQTASVPRKGRGLRRSQTIFIDVKQLPVINSAAPSRASHLHASNMELLRKPAIKSLQQAPRFASAFGAESHKSPASRSREFNLTRQTEETGASEEEFIEYESYLPGYIPE